MKKVYFILGVFIIGGLIWYLFVYRFDYLVTFNAKANSGTINQTIKLWNSTLDGAEIEVYEDLQHLTQTIPLKDSTHVYDWRITTVNDSTSKIKVFAKDSNHSLLNKIKVPFSDTDFEKRTRKMLLDFNEKLREHIDNIKIEVIGVTEVDSIFCAYLEVKSSQFGKAGGMMKNFPLLDPFLVNNGATLNGLPIIEVTKWDTVKDSIEFNFCYPILPSDSLPVHPDLKYKMIPSKKAIKAIYNGNYITSDRAWYALMDYAEKKNLDITGHPLEFFYNNPNMGGNELNWKAEIFMPLKE
ncbi:MAG: AraC family transcriptional regulator [Eudoraea sp.]|nr:AraC family transcriptional regulator [Eudoraea sp.]